MAVNRNQFFSKFLLSSRTRLSGSNRSSIFVPTQRASAGGFPDLDSRSCKLALPVGRLTCLTRCESDTPNYTGDGCTVDCPVCGRCHDSKNRRLESLQHIQRTKGTSIHLNLSRHPLY